MTTGHFVKTIKCVTAGRPPKKNITHRKFLEVTAVQRVVKMLGDVFPGGKPVVSLLLPCVVMVPP